MSFSTQHSHSARPFNLLPTLGSIEEKLGHLIRSVKNSVNASHEFERLNRLSDPELKELDLTRDKLPQYLAARYFQD